MVQWPSSVRDQAMSADRPTHWSNRSSPEVIWKSGSGLLTKGGDREDLAFTEDSGERSTGQPVASTLSPQPLVVMSSQELQCP